MVASTVKIEPLYTTQNGKMVLNRKRFTQYTSGQREVKQMDDALFFDYVNFLMRQQDVNMTEGLKDAIETTKKAKDIKTYTEFIKVSKTVLTTLLIGAIVFLCVIIPIYAYVFRKDIVKSTINYQLFPLTFYLVVMFGFYVFLYLNMNSLVKKIMTLL
jgi:hypothetical protein